MPYLIKKVKDGFKVCKKDNSFICFSKKGIPLNRAKKQQIAINLNESKNELIEKAEEKVGKIPKKYIPKSLSISDLKKQLKSIIEGIKRPKLKSFKSKESKWTKKAKEYFGENRSLKDISKKLNIDIKGLKEIYKKGEGAYYSSGSRPNQTPESWAYGRVYAVLFGSPAREKDKKIVDKYNIPLLKVGGGKKEKTQFEKRLKKIGFPASVYLKIARDKAEKYGLDRNKLIFSDKKLKKLNYEGVDFGSSLNNDFIIYNFFEVKGKEPKGTAKKRRELYRKRATKIKGEWKKNKISPNNLSINILW